MTIPRSKPVIFLHLTVCFVFCFSCLPIAVAQNAVPVKTERVQLAQFRDQIEALGTLRANESVALTVNATETISAIHFNDGERVEAGQLLVEMTSAEESAQLAEAESNLHEADRQLTRVRRLVKEGNASDALLDERERNKQAAEARLMAVQSRLKDRIVRAPFAGQLGLRNISVGALKQPGDVITTLIDDSKMKLDFTVPETFLPVLQPKLKIEARSSAYKDKVFGGSVVSIDNQVNPVTRAITVRALLPNTDKLLKQGMLLKITLFMNEREGLALSESALLPEGNRQFVMVVQAQDDKRVVEKREIALASRKQGRVEVHKGLTLNEEVVTDGGFKLRSGMAVTVLPTGAP